MPSRSFAVLGIAALAVTLARCDVHPWMVSWAYVTEDNRTAITGASGEFKIENVPAGEYKLTIFFTKVQEGTP